MLVPGAFFQIGIVVRTINEGKERYRSMIGIGQFGRLDTLDRLGLVAKRIINEMFKRAVR